jgi:predicted HTH domain antitoxin
MTVLQIEYPADLLDQAGQTKEALEDLAREALLVRLYDQGKLSSGRAAKLLGISRRAFLDVLGQYNVSYFDETMDVAAEGGTLALMAQRSNRKARQLS